MFTGIIEKTAKIINISQKRIIIENVFEELRNGESISVDGVCLTLTYFDKKEIFFDISPHTYSVTRFKYLKNGEIVNLERALKVGDRLGGHIVTGHIDEVGIVYDIKREDDFYVFIFEVSDTNLLVEKGSVCINGISLTCYDISKNKFKVSVIPHTYNNTNLKNLSRNSKVNIEFDIIAKYLKKNSSSRITLDFLKQNGFV
jgi:riboflavin synthase